MGGKNATASGIKLLTLDSIVDAAEQMSGFQGDDSVQMKLDLIVELCRQC